MNQLSRKQVREVDRLAIQELGLPGVVLMENAGRNAAAVVLEVLGETCKVAPSDAQVAILCGGGNNGGDGYVIARHLANQGVTVTVYTTVEPAKLNGDAATNHVVYTRMGLPVWPVTNLEQLNEHAPAWSKAHVVVDALLGTGFSGTVRPNLASVIERCNALEDSVVVAVDVPSGLDCDTGQPSNATIKAQVTVTFVAEKKGFAASEAPPYTGRVAVVDIGSPPQLVDRVLSGV